ncbi:MAG TPA: cyclopropane-fatty-acyl-phospholipid synthase family protein [Solirubrobacteraceae bacterium]
MALARTAPLRSALAEALPDRPFTVAFWDGTELEATAPGPRLTVRSPRAAGHALRAPGELGIGRAYVSGEIEVDDLDAAVEMVRTWTPPEIDRATKARLALGAARAMGFTRPPPRPQAELVPDGRRYSLTRDRRAVRHHYDLPPGFFALFLDASMTYSCALFSRGATTLEEAQEAKLELVCTKLGLKPGQRVLDVGCGWGSFALHAARRHGVHVTGITLSPPQAEAARARAAEAGLADQVDIRVQDWRELESGRFDAIASIGMVEHVGEDSIDAYALRLRELLAPDGRLLNHGIARLTLGDPRGGPFTQRYVFPDGAPLRLSRIALAMERAGLGVDHVEGLAADYAETLRHWYERLDEHLDEAIALAGPERVRVWRLYLRAARWGFQNGFTSIFQVRAAPLPA